MASSIRSPVRLHAEGTMWTAMELGDERDPAAFSNIDGGVVAQRR